MSLIRCSAHLDCKATFVCQSCGFLCDKHTQEEQTKKHDLIAINDCINKLYQSTTSKEHLAEQLSFVKSIEEKMSYFLKNEAEYISKSIEECQYNMKQYLSTELGMDCQKLSSIIEDSIKADQMTKPSENENEINKLKDFIDKFAKQKLAPNSVNSSLKGPTPVPTKIDQKPSIETAKAQDTPKEMSVVQKWSESEWKAKYGELVKKYGLDDSRIMSAEKIMQGKAKNQGKYVITDLMGSHLEDDGALAIAYAIKNTNLLQTIDMDNNKIGETGAIALAMALMENTSLTIVGLSMNNLGDEGAISMAQMLKINRTLTIIGLGQNSIGNKGAQAIAEALKMNKTLQVINIRKNMISDVGAKAIAEMLRVNQTLTTVEMHGNSISDELKEILIKSKSQACNKFMV